jgi:AcrR family transcriptional regulator
MPPGAGACPRPERRQAILDAALTVFGLRGYHGASIDLIAQQAGVSKALIYEHFGSKRELHAALLAGHTAELFLRLQANARSGRTGEERLRGGLDAFLAWVQERRDVWRTLFRDSGEPELAEEFRAVQVQVVGVVEELMTSGPEGPRLARLPPDERALAIELLATQLSGALQLLANWWDERRDVPRQVLVDRAMDFAWTGLERVGREELPPRT